MKTKRLIKYLTASFFLFTLTGVLQSWAIGPGGVAITSPFPNANITASCSTALANLTITAITLDQPPTNGGGGGFTTTQVEFYYGGTQLIGTDYSRPYSVTWSGVSPGTYSLTAKAYFSNGQITTSSAVTVTVKSPATTLDSDKSGYTFQSGKTYYIKNPITISGTTVLQAGTVLKYAPNALILTDYIDCQTASNNPAILTARDDDSVGCMLPESTHVISGYYGGTTGSYTTTRGALSVMDWGNASPIVKHVRVSNANCGLYFVNFTALSTLEDVAINHCQTGTFLDGASGSTLSLLNVQISDVNTALDGSYWQGVGNLISVSSCYNLAHDYCPGPLSVIIDNSLFSDVSYLSVDGSIVVDGDSNGFHSSPQFGTNPYTY